MSGGHAEQGEHAGGRLAEYVLGTLSDEERGLVEAHLGGCETCTRDCAAIADALAARSLVEPAPLPSPAVRERLLRTISGGGRLHRFAARVAAFLDVAEDRARAMLDRLDDPGAWNDLPIPGHPGLAYQSPELGPGLDGASVSWLRLRPGARFPRHKHLGAESVMALSGGFRDDTDGREFGPGEVQEMEPGTKHSFTAVPGPDCVVLAVARGGITIGGYKL